ncbi:phage baseplate protein [Methylobacterium sp. CCH5-D2]|uniref:phage baseplate protein n=1 Tax=Methylobacterium sp. CCH5-D2 TaxID=1768765 RepID=UPI0008303A8A|nr:hypothetical protein [Methylobacterium sp. CCH5-D2]
MALLDDFYALLVPTGSVIGSLVTDVVVSEVHQDAVAITDHPVEIGASVSDHAFILPERLEMRIGYSDATGGYVGYSREQYEAVLNLMAAREPFQVFTAKRAYRDMLVEFVGADTTDQTTNAAMLIVRLRRVRLARARGGGGGAGGGGIAPNGSQASPEATGAWKDVGTVLPTEVNIGGLSGLSTQISPNAVGFGTLLPNTESGIGRAPGGGGFGLSGPSGNAAF